MFDRPVLISLAIVSLVAGTARAGLPLPVGGREEFIIAGAGGSIAAVSDDRYRIRLKLPSKRPVFSWTIYNARGGLSLRHGGRGEERLGMLLQAWDVMFRGRAAQAMLTLVLDPSHPEVLSLAIEKPILQQQRQWLVLYAQKQETPSPNLALAYPDAMAHRVNAVPVGPFTSSYGLVIDNATRTAHNLLGTGLAVRPARRNPIALSGDCAPAQTTIAWVDAYIDERPDIKRIRGRWDDLPLSASDKAAIKKQFPLPCDPVIDVKHREKNPENVRTIMAVLTPAKWRELTTLVGRGEVGPFDANSFTYRNFLAIAARHPYLCGEKGVYDNAEEACRREIAAIFAHAAQETGKHDAGLKLPEWRQAFYYIRELNSYPDDPRYDPDVYPNPPCLPPFACPSTAHYYGRGIKQLTHFYNYAAFSAEYFNNYQMLLTDPDIVGRRAYPAIASGLWFLMTPQPPKPSMHDVLIGAYKPKGPYAGLEVDDDGSVRDKFEATVSIINGGYECSPTSADTLQQSKNRFSYYQALLGYFGAMLTPVEAAYIPGVSYCRMQKGNPWAGDELQAPLIYNPKYYLDTLDKTCKAVTYQQPVPLMIAPEGMYEVCLKMR